jgi:hypothetical protein
MKMPVKTYKTFMEIYSGWDVEVRSRFWISVFVIISSIVVMIIVLRSVRKIEYDTHMAEGYKEQAETYRKGVITLIDQVNAITLELKSNRQRDSLVIQRSMNAIQQIEHIDEVIKQINENYEKATDFTHFNDDQLTQYVSSEAAYIRSH